MGLTQMTLGEAAVVATRDKRRSAEKINESRYETSSGVAELGKTSQQRDAPPSGIPSQPNKVRYTQEGIWVLRELVSCIWMRGRVSHPVL